MTEETLGVVQLEEEARRDLPSDRLLKSVSASGVDAVAGAAITGLVVDWHLGFSYSMSQA
jgi:hypothetical protein